MKKRYLYVLPLTLILGAYSSSSYGQMKCEERDPIDNKECTGMAKVPAIHVNLEEMIVTPRCAVAQKGTTIVIMLTPRKGLRRNTVTVSPKNPSDFWLRGTNDEFRHLIIIEVPGVHDPEGPVTQPTYHDFGISSQTKCLDPRIKVEH